MENAVKFLVKFCDVLQLQMPKFTAFFTLQTFVLARYALILRQTSLTIHMLYPVNSQAPSGACPEYHHSQHVL